MTSEEKTRRAIQRVMDVTGMSARSLAVAAGLSATTINDFLSGRSRSFRVETLTKVAAVAGLSVDDVLGDPDRTDLQDRLLRLMERLSPDEQRRLIASLEALVPPEE